MMRSVILFCFLSIIFLLISNYQVVCKNDDDKTSKSEDAGKSKSDNSTEMTLKASIKPLNDTKNAATSLEKTSAVIGCGALISVAIAFL